MRVIQFISATLYAIAAAALTLIALVMIARAGVLIWHAVDRGEGIEVELLDAVGLVIVAVAVFDVSKYLVEEGVIRRQELRAPHEARAALTKFLSIIIIAISLETLVFIFGAGRTDMTLLLYPALLFLGVVLAPIALGLFQRLSREAEERSQAERG